MSVDCGQQVNRISGECIGASGQHRVPDRSAVATAGIKPHSAMAIGPGERGVVVRVADDTEHMPEREPVLHGAVAVDRSHRVEIAAIRLRCLRAAMHRVHLDEG